jgi:homoserine dehydrogenase
MSEPLGIALLGCGTVGGGVAQLLMEHADRLARRASRVLELRHVVVRHPEKKRSCDVPPALFMTDLSKVLNDPRVHVVVELVGGIAWAKDAVLAALAAGKDVVTANKALLAEFGTEVFAAAQRHSRAVAFEGSVAGGIPIIGALTHGLAANQVTRLQGILNGTCNFILSAMTEHNSDYSAALSDAQRSGYAEADPTLDVDGSDTAHKLAVLSCVAFGAAVSPKQIERRGITDISPLDIRLAGELGCVIKLIADSQLHDGELILQVAPVLVKRGTPLADVAGAFNAVRVVGDAVGDTLFYGAGAGAMQTASAVVADIIDMAVGRAQLTFKALRLWEPLSGIRLRSTDHVVNRFYIRLTVDDLPGVLAEAAGLLAMERISIAEVIQHEAAGDGSTSLVIATHPAPTGKLRAALKRIDQSASLREPAVHYAMGP